MLLPMKHIKHDFQNVTSKGNKRTSGHTVTEPRANRVHSESDLDAEMVINSPISSAESL
jgi:hypothetical protein